jgi:hypothetical protein
LVGRYAFDVSDEHGEARTHRCRSIRFVGRLQPSVYFETRRLRYGSASRRARFHETSMFRLTLIGLNHRPCVWFLCRGPRSRWPDSGGLWRSKSSGCGTHSSAWAETIRGRPESRAADLLRAAPPQTHTAEHLGPIASKGLWLRVSLWVASSSNFPFQVSLPRFGGALLVGSPVLLHHSARPGGATARCEERGD